MSLFVFYKIVTGCVNHPGGNKDIYCSLHKGLQQPIVEAKKVSQENKGKLREEKRKENPDFEEKDEVFVIEGIYN